MSLFVEEQIGNVEAIYYSKKKKKLLEPHPTSCIFAATFTFTLTDFSKLRENRLPYTGPYDMAIWQETTNLAKNVLNNDIRYDVEKQADSHVSTSRVVMPPMLI